MILQMFLFLVDSLMSYPSIHHDERLRFLIIIIIIIIIMDIDLPKMALWRRPIVVRSRIVIQRSRVRVPLSHQDRCRVRTFLH